MILIVTHLPRCCFGFFQKPEQTDLLSPEAENSKKEIAAITEGPKAGEGDVKIDTTPTKKSESKQTTTIQKPPAVVSQMQGDFITPVTSGPRESVTALTSPPPDLPRMQPPLIECDPFENLDEFDQFETKEFIPMEIPLGGYEFSICPDYPIIDTLSVPSFTPGTIETAEFQPGMPLGMFDYSYCPDNQSLSSVHYLSQLVMDAELDAAKKIIAEKKLKSAEKKLKIQTSSDTIDVPIEIPAIPGPSTRKVSILESPKDPLKRKPLPSTLEEDFDEFDIPSKPKEPTIIRERKASAEGDTTETKVLIGTGVVAGAIGAGAVAATAEGGGAQDLVQVGEDKVRGVTASEAIIEASDESKEAKTIDDEKPDDEPLSDTNAEPGTLYLTPEPESTTGPVAKVPSSPSSAVASSKTAVPVASLTTEPKESGQMRIEEISGTAVPVTTTSTDQPPIYSKRNGEIIGTVVPIPTVSTDQAPSEAKKRGEIKTGETSETAGPGPIASSDQTPIEPKVSGEIKPEDAVTASTDETLKKVNESEEKTTDEPPTGSVPSAADERTELDAPIAEETSAPDVALVAAISGDIKPEDTAPAEEKSTKDEPATLDISLEQDLPLATDTSEKLSEPASAEVPTASMEQIPPVQEISGEMKPEDVSPSEDLLPVDEPVTTDVVPVVDNPAEVEEAPKAKPPDTTSLTSKIPPEADAELVADSAPTAVVPSTATERAPVDKTIEVEKATKAESPADASLIAAVPLEADTEPVAESPRAAIVPSAESAPPEVSRSVAGYRGNIPP